MMLYINIPECVPPLTDDQAADYAALVYNHKTQIARLSICTIAKLVQRGSSINSPISPTDVFDVMCKLTRFEAEVVEPELMENAAYQESINTIQKTYELLNTIENMKHQTYIDSLKQYCSNV